MEPRALADIRSCEEMTVASGESLFGRRQYLPFLAERAMDVAIVDVVWNGLLESLAVASLAAAHEVAVAPHNFYGHLSSLISAHFCLLVENFRIMEVDVDDVPWKDDLVTAAPAVVGGRFVLPDGPGWGADVDEDALAAHPPREAGSSGADAGVATR
jgi:L-alanine-DL-glutamate epimerase-like enolase superfamily enzyme